MRITTEGMTTITTPSTQIKLTKIAGGSNITVEKDGSIRIIAVHKTVKIDDVELEFLGDPNDLVTRNNATFTPEEGKGLCLVIGSLGHDMDVM